jgi:hypothetical protein
MGFGWAYTLSLLGDATSTKSLPPKENVSKKFSQGPLSELSIEEIEGTHIPDFSKTE